MLLFTNCEDESLTGAITGRILISDWEAREGVKIELKNNIYHSETTTTEDGMFWFENLPRDNYYGTATKASYDTVHFSVAILGNGKPNILEIRMKKTGSPYY